MCLTPFQSHLQPVAVTKSCSSEFHKLIMHRVNKDFLWSIMNLLAAEFHHRGLALWETDEKRDLCPLSPHSKFHRLSYTPLAVFSLKRKAPQIFSVKCSNPRLLAVHWIQELSGQWNLSPIPQSEMVPQFALLLWLQWHHWSRERG